jgi:hypothetical protein
MAAPSTNDDFDQLPPEEGNVKSRCYALPPVILDAERSRYYFDEQQRGMSQADIFKLYEERLARANTTLPHDLAHCVYVIISANEGVLEYDQPIALDVVPITYESYDSALRALLDSKGDYHTNALRNVVEIGSIPADRFGVLFKGKSKRDVRINIAQRQRANEVHALKDAHLRAAGHLK